MGGVAQSVVIINLGQKSRIEGFKDLTELKRSMIVFECKLDE